MNRSRCCFEADSGEPTVQIPPLEGAILWRVCLRANLGECKSGCNYIGGCAVGGGDAFLCHVTLDIYYYYRVVKINAGLLLKDDNTATVRDRKACDMSTVSTFCLEKRIKLVRLGTLIFFA